VIKRNSYEDDLNIENTIKLGVYSDNCLKHIFIKKSLYDKFNSKKFI